MLCYVVFEITVIKGKTMDKVKQNACQDMVALNKVLEMLDYISARVVLIEKTPAGERYSVVHDKDGAYVYITNTGATINIFRDNNMVLRGIVSAKNGAGVQSALDSLRNSLDLQSKLEQILKPSKIIKIKPKTLEVSSGTLKVASGTLKVAQQTLQVSEVIIDVSKRQH